LFTGVSLFTWVMPPVCRYIFLTYLNFSGAYLKGNTLIGDSLLAEYIRQNLNFCNHAKCSNFCINKKKV
ncbi:MAG: hypothetical protein LC096_03390, partial [Bacteroidia bacterium]|nr:hypothetical protein [Bacteroidia bacterium]